MNEFVKQVYIMEIAAQCAFGLRAIIQANEVEPRVEAGKADVYEYFRCLHSFLVHYGNVSLMFYPGRSRNAEAQNRARTRAETLRNEFGLPAAGHLLEDRGLRNSLEHYDEYLDAWAAADGKTYVDMNIGPIDAIRIRDGHERHVMRSFNLQTNVFTFQDKAYNIQPMVTTLETIKTRADELLEELRRRER